jgi:eukaryotic-like serine/threonine-protein kinase
VTGLQEELQASLGSQYTLERELGGGGMSRVFLAVENTLGRWVVVKVLAPDMMIGVSVERFRREIMMVARLQHPNIVPVIAAGEAAGLPYFTMPLVEGESLRARIVRSGELPVPEVVRILRGVASALAYAHENGVVHRDIKPDNILLGKHHALVADFGVAKALSASATQAQGPLTSVGVALGTPTYMAPEQALADPNVDGRADLYALGVVAYEMLTGYPPFTGASPQAILGAHRTEPAQPVATRRPATPPALAALVMRLLEKRPADRPQSAEEVIAAIESLATPSGVTVPAGVTVPTTIEKPGPSPRQWRLIGGAATAVAVIALGAAAVILFGRTPPPKPAAQAPSPAPRPVQSVAVLPFTNVGHDTAAEYFAEGMADELTTALAHVPGLRVAARSTAFTYKGTTLGAQDIGQRLRVSDVLEGSVLRVGGRFRLTAQLVSTSDGLAVWSDSYERHAADVFQVQDELARNIAGALNATLTAADTGANATSLAPRGTTNLAAYDLFLQGRYFFSSGNPASLRRAATLFQQAIAKDPSFARAHAELAMSYVLLSRYGGARADSDIALGEKSATRALSFDPENAEAHLALGDVRIHQWRWAEAERELDHSLELDPQNPLVHLWHADLFLGLGQVDQAVDHAKMAYDLDPLTPLGNQTLGTALVDAHRFDEAATAARHGLGLDSTLAGLHTALREAELFGGHRDSAVAAANRALRLARGAPGVRSVATWVYMSAGRQNDADALVAEMRRGLARGTVPALDYADAQLALGNTDSALVWVERSVRRHDAEPVWNGLACDPTYDGLKRDPRFVAIMQPTGMHVCQPTK